LLNFLMTAEGEMKEACVEKLCAITIEHSPSPRWQVDTSVRVMELADQEQDTLLSTLVQLVASSPDLQGYTTQKLYVACIEAETEGERRDALPELSTLVKATFWCLGEYGNLLISGGGGIEEEEAIEVSEDDVLDLFERLMNDMNLAAEAKVYGLTGLVKLANRFSGNALGKIRELVSPFMSNKDMEVQQRAVEFSQLLSKSSLWDKVLSAVPAANMGGDEEGLESPSMPIASNTSNISAAPAASGGLDDLIGGMGMQPAPAPAPASSGGLDDLLGDLLGPTNPAPAPAPAPSGGDGLDSLLGGLDLGGPPAPVQQQQQQGPPSHVGYQKNGLTITFECRRNPQNPSMITLRATYLNQSAGAMSNFAIQTAAPKEMKLRLQPISSSNIDQGGKAQQLIGIMNPQNLPLRLMMKIMFVVNGQQVQDQAIAEGFPNF
jgi:AP-1 complex subunit gamma-1